MTLAAIQPNEFEELTGARERIARLCEKHVATLNRFHVGGGNLSQPTTSEIRVEGFSHLLKGRGSDDGKVSLASTATCLNSLFSLNDFSARKGINYATLRKELKERVEAEKLYTGGLPHGNPFTVGLLLPVLEKMEMAKDDEVVKYCLDCAKTAVSRAGVGMPYLQSPDKKLPQPGDPPAGETGAAQQLYPSNGYLTYWCLKGIEAWEGLEETRNLAERCLAWSQREFFYQISLYASGADDDTDAFQLGYNLLIQYRYQRAQVRDTVIRLGLKTLFDAQLTRGVWEKREPLFVYGSRGDAYCFPFELLTALLREFSQDLDFLRPHEQNLVKSFDWIRRNAIVLSDDPEVGPMWRSGDVITNREPESWATAEVYHFLQLYRTYLSWRIQTIVLNRFKGTPNPKPDKQAFGNLYQPVVPVRDRKPEPLSDVLKGILDPLRIGETYSLARNTERKQRLRSGILFGPPGTGKTTYVKAVAAYLGWPVVILDPSHFASDGLAFIASVATRIFEQLMELEDTVIFFDEMEELVRDRNPRGEKGSDRPKSDTTFEQRFLTTTLLPKLQDLQSHARSMFFLATNHYETLDPAVRREGRFDFKLQILPPSVPEKMRMIQESVKKKVTLNAWKKIETELSHHEEQLKWATRFEIQDLMGRLQQKGSDIREILDGFQPRLLKEKNEIEEDARNNDIPLSLKSH